jgi:hypothetical protein
VSEAREELERAKEQRQRVADQLAKCRQVYTAQCDQIAAWRHNYRVTLQALHDENNALRAAAATLSAKLAAKEAPRSLLEKFFNLPKD